MEESYPNRYINGSELRKWVEEHSIPDKRDVCACRYCLDEPITEAVRNGQDVTCGRIAVPETCDGKYIYPGTVLCDRYGSTWTAVAIGVDDHVYCHRGRVTDCPSPTECVMFGAKDLFGQIREPEDIVSDLLKWTEEHGDEDVSGLVRELSAALALDDDWDDEEFEDW